MNIETKNGTMPKEVETSVKILIEMVDRLGYENPDIDVECVIANDGRVFRLKFERVDLDFTNDKRNVQRGEEKSFKACKECPHPITKCSKIGHCDYE